MGLPGLPMEVGVPCRMLFIMTITVMKILSPHCATVALAECLWTPEVRSSKTAEEWLRRMQSVCFSPMAMLNAWASGTKPWSFPEVEKQVKEIALLRMQLMPYFYTAFARYHFEGIPPFRAMNLEEGFSASDNEWNLKRPA